MPRLLEHGASSEHPPAGPRALRVLDLDCLEAFPLAQTGENLGFVELTRSGPTN